jgi:hypothetical protein
MPGKDELPSTLARSPEKAHRTWVETHDSAVEECGGGARPSHGIRRGEALIREGR